MEPSQASPPPKPAPVPAGPAAPSGVYWPTVALGVAAAAVLGAALLREVRRRAPAEPEEAPVVFSSPEHVLSAPSPSALKAGRPMSPAAESSSPAIPVSAAQDSSLGMVRGETGMSVQGRAPADPFTQEGSLAEAVGVAPPLSFTGQGGPSALTTRIVRGPNEWRALWREIAHGKAPAVDFKSQMLVAVFAGRQSSDTGVRVVSAAERGGRLRVVYDLPRGPSAPSGKKTWKPYHIVAVPRTSARAEFVLQQP